MGEFSAFLRAFPPTPDGRHPVDVESTVSSVQKHFGISLPPSLVAFWHAIGSGLFADNELFVFGPESEGRASLIEWNRKEFWREIFPTPEKGGPFFIAETCFGRQIGFTISSGVFLPSLLDVDTMRMYRLGDNWDDLFERILADRYAVTNKDILDGVLARYHTIPRDMHFAPIVSLLIGGSFAPDNYHVESPELHVRLTIKTWQSIP